MLTSAVDLLHQTAAVASGAHGDVDLADDAVRALYHLGRALAELSHDPHAAASASRTRRALVTSELATASRQAAAKWPLGSGRLCDLAGAAADQIICTVPGRSGEECWAGAIEVGRAIRSCTDAARSFAPYGDVPVSNTVRRLAAVQDGLAHRDRPAPGAGAWLERLLPALDIDVDAVDGLITLTARLVDAVDREVGGGTLQLISLMAATAASESVAGCAQAATAMSANPGSRTRSQPPAAQAWRVVQNALIRFDDGSRYASRAPSPIIETTLALSRQLSHLGSGGTDEVPPAGLAAAVTQLPYIAELTGTAVQRWVGEGRLFARARSLPGSEEHVTAVIRDQVVTVVPRDIGPVLMTARATARLFAALALDLDRSADQIARAIAPRQSPRCAQWSDPTSMPAMPTGPSWRRPAAAPSARPPLSADPSRLDDGVAPADHTKLV